MNTASQALSQQLFDLSGWGSTACWWFKHNDEAWQLDAGHANQPTNYSNENGDQFTPAYDASYLIRKIAEVGSFEVVVGYSLDNGAYAMLSDGGDQYPGDTPEDALVALAVQLFEDGTFTKAGDDE